jgi:predicted RNA-binding Zn ribbon-like protein
MAPGFVGAGQHDPAHTGVVTGVLDDLPVADLAFRFSRGRLCLDFVATVGERWRRSFERLPSPEDLGRWLVAAALLETAPVIRRDDLAKARKLPEAIYRLARPGGRHTLDVRDVPTVNRWAALPPLAPRLGSAGRSVSWDAEPPARAAPATIARDAIDLISGPLVDRVRECARPDCALLFVDASRPGTRRWCSMAACGDRTKAAAYRRRRRRAEAT